MAKKKTRLFAKITPDARRKWIVNRESILKELRKDVETTRKYRGLDKNWIRLAKTKIKNLSVLRKMRALRKKIWALGPVNLNAGRMYGKKKAELTRMKKVFQMTQGYLRDPKVWPLHKP